MPEAPRPSELRPLHYSRSLPVGRVDQARRELTALIHRVTRKQKETSRKPHRRRPSHIIERARSGELATGCGIEGKKEKGQTQTQKTPVVCSSIASPGGGNRFVVLSRRSCSVSPVTKYFLRLQWQRHTPQLPAKCKWEKNKICIARIVFVLPIHVTSLCRYPKGQK